jgi:hypothetical protein
VVIVVGEGWYVAWAVPLASGLLLRVFRSANEATSTPDVPWPLYPGQRRTFGGWTSEMVTASASTRQRRVLVNRSYWLGQQSE